MLNQTMLKAVKKSYISARSLSSKKSHQGKAQVNTFKFSGNPKVSTNHKIQPNVYYGWQRKLNLARDSLVIVGVVVGIVAAFSTCIDFFVAKLLEKHMDVDRKELKITMDSMRNETNKKFVETDAKLDTIIRLLQSSWWKF